MTSSIKLPPPPKKKSAGEQFKEDLIYWLLIMGIFWIFSSIFKMIVAPFKILITSDREKFERQKQVALGKVQLRNARRTMNGLNSETIVNQYIERFRLHPERYVDDPDNIIYEKWHEALMNGTLLDTELQWAPRVYVEDYEGKNYCNEEFLNYIERQVELHQQDTMLSRYKFCRTIRNYFPEFTPRLSMIPLEIAELRERAISRKLKMELIEEIIKKGIPKELAIDLVNLSEKSPENLLKRIAIVKKCLELQYSVSMCRYCLKVDYEPDEYSAACNELVTSFEYGENIASALRRGDVTPEDISRLIKENTYDSVETTRKYVNRAFYQLLHDRVMSIKK